MAGKDGKTGKAGALEVLAAIQKKLRVPKNQYNKFGGYNYRSCEDTLEALKPHLAEHGAVVILSDEIVQVGERYYIKATASLTVGDESITTVAYAREAAVKKGMDDSQITGASSSYARKYALNGLFGIDDQKDADSTNTHGKRETASGEKHDDGKESLKELVASIEKCKTLEELKDWWEAHTKEVANLPENYRIVIREMKESMKRHFLNTPKEEEYEEI